jgi:murein DD-endopeptidase MepM/ murein hydrolase activator NlpD
MQPHGAIQAGEPLTLPASARDGGVDPYATGPAPRAIRGADTVAAAAAPPSRPAAPPAVAAPVAGSPSARGRGRFIWPVRGDILTRFGAIGGGIHNDGINIAAPDGTPVKAAADGEVVYAGSVIAAFGNMVLIKHADGWVTAYGYMSRIDVHMRDTVRQGQVIGAVGSSGGVPQPQLHFEIRYSANPRDKAAAVDPTPLLR